MAPWFDGSLVQRQKPKTLEMRLVGSLNRLVVRQMQVVLLKLEADIVHVEVITISTTSNWTGDNDKNPNEMQG